MPLELNKIQEYKQQGNTAVLVRERPAVRLKSGDNPPLWIQAGKVWPEGRGAPHIPKNHLPGWFLEEVVKIDPKKLEACGYKLAKDQMNG